MTREEFIRIFKGDSKFWTGDNAYKGLQIIAKYYGPEDTLITGAGHDILYSVSLDDLIERGVSRDDAEKLRELNWSLEGESYLFCYV